MRVQYGLRKGVTWQDRAPFTASDLVFSYRLNSDPGLPVGNRDVLGLIQTVEAPDDHTFVFHFKQPYYMAGTLGFKGFWPQPRHLLESPYDRYVQGGNADQFLNLPYWTSEYIHLGAFRLAVFEPGESMTFEAYEGYFLGKPKLSTVYVKSFGDPNALFAAILAGTVDLLMESTLSPDLGFELAKTWAEGTVYHKYASHRMLAPQWRPGVQVEPANLDVRVRAALYHAIDRKALSDALQGGLREMAAWEILPANDPLYSAVKDGLRRYTYEPARAQGILRDVGWVPGPDGILRNAADGRRFRNPLSATDFAIRDMPAYAAYWRQIGIDVQELATPAAQVRNPEYRASYPGWEVTAQSGGDGILGKLEGPASSAPRWVGNRGGCEDPRAQRLVNAYRASISERDQFETMRAVSDFIAAELPFLPLYGTIDPIAVRKGQGAGRP